MKAFGKQVNAAIVDPSFISTVRKKLDLDQCEAAKIFGGGANSFSRYENGKTTPPLVLLKKCGRRKCICCQYPKALDLHSTCFRTKAD